MKKEDSNCRDKNDYNIEYSITHVLIDNIPYITMVLIGAGILWYTINVLFASLVVAYGLLGSLWFIVLICPYCHKEFYVFPHQIKRGQKYCSRECFNKSRKGQEFPWLKRDLTQNNNLRNPVFPL